MRNLLKAEICKFRYSKFVWIILCILFSLSTNDVSSGNNDIIVGGNITVLVVACAIYCALTVTDDFSNGMMRRYICNGYKKENIIISKYIHCIIGCTVILIFYMYIPAISYIIAGETRVAITVFSVLIRSIPLYCSICSLFFFVAIVSRKGIVAMSISVVTAIVLVILSDNLFSDNVLSTIRFFPVTQMQLVAKNIQHSFEYLMAVCISLVLIAVFFGGSTIIFKHQEF